MSKKKSILKWSLLIFTALLYIAIGAIPFFNSLHGNGRKILYALTVGEIIVLGVMLAILIAVVVLALKKRARVSSMIREYESECKRITWLSWKDTKKSCVVVLIALVICAVVISLLDLGLAEGILAFVGLFGKK